MPTDWTHDHVIFGGIGDFARHNEFMREDRYWQQSVRRNLMQSVPSQTGRKRHEESLASTSAVISYPVGPARGVLRHLDKRDWSESLGQSITVGWPPPVNFPAKYSFQALNPTPDCTNDYAVFTSQAAGSSSNFNIIAFNKLYVDNSGTGFCSGTLPAAIFDYNASLNGGILSSPVLSLDGTRIAFVERSNPARFSVLLWKNGDVAATFPQSKNASNLPTCAASNPTAPCLYSVAYGQSATASFSEPFVDYDTDTAYVTDDSGRLFAISPVFNGGTPVIKTGYPIVLGANAMTSPVYDFGSRNVFAADTNTGVLYFVRTAAASSGSCASGSPPCRGSNTITLAASSTPRITDAPFVDSTNGTVFAFTNAPAVVQSNTTLSSTLATASLGSTSANLTHSGAFDNNYFNGVSTRRLYACGINSNGPQLYAFGFNGSAVMNTTPVSGAPLTLVTGGTATYCPALTEVFNNSQNKDLLFVGPGNNCAFSAGGNGCLMSFDISGTFPSTPLASFAIQGGTQGMIIDNVTNAGTGGSSSTNVYFMNRNATSTCNRFVGGGTTNNANCMIKLTQNGLQ